MDNRWKGPSVAEIKILVVEDSPVQALQLSHFLKHQGFPVVQVNNGHQALARIRQHMPSLVISDVLMPEMDGFELCRCIKADESLKALPVILLTTLSDPEDIIRGLQCGANSFESKPYDEEYLLSRIDHVLQNAVVRKNAESDEEINIFYAGHSHMVTAEPSQLLDLLLTTYETTIVKSRKLETSNSKLREIQQQLSQLNGALEQKIAERTHNVLHLNLLLRIIRQVNQLIVKEKDANRLIKQTCEILTDNRNYAGCWIVLLDEGGGYLTSTGIGMDQNITLLARRYADRS